MAQTKVTMSTVLIKQSIDTQAKTEVKACDVITGEYLTMEQTQHFIRNLEEAGNCVFRGFKYTIK